MPIHHPMPERPRQLLPKEAYLSAEWLEMEHDHLFSKAWKFAGAANSLATAGSYKTLKAGRFPLILLRKQDGEFAAYHNLCRHRGTELLEGEGQLKNNIVCPYHRWTFGLGGELRGIPNQQECFPDINKGELGLKPASVGVFKGLVFVHPDPAPELCFEDWLGGLQDVAWPYDISAGDLVPSRVVTYEMKCNWKVFYENAIDGYHLGYLHENTLGPLFPNANTWSEHGQHLVWYSTEREGARNAVPTLVEKTLDSFWVKKVDKKDRGEAYGGVYMLFPTTIVTPNPYGVSISELIPVGPEMTLLVAQSWSPKGSSGRFADPRRTDGYDKERDLITSDKWKRHPLEMQDFQAEDVWVCEKMQRSLRSPAFEIGALAAGRGAEAPLEHFQRCLLDYVPGDLRVAAD